ncbi:hypothetical protein ACIO1C_20520 [Streptomyces sp. NPDC087420]|uniref:hypothetical protein n=1 Tax=Streptomyces sp. NPDC087420 TaxID=3365785 RepID=UPI00383744B8
MKDGRAWVGDQVYDGTTDRKAIVTDVQQGTTYVLGPILGGGENWVAEDAEKLTVTEPLVHGAEAP